MAFDLHITSTKDIKSLNIVFSDNTTVSTVTKAPTVNAPTETKESLLSPYDVIKPKQTKITKAKAQIPTDVIDINDRPQRIANELNNLEL